MKRTLSILLLSISFTSKAQKVEDIYVNLYTDSLKKGTFNYINIDGRLSNGKYLPLDSTHIIFWASAGKFSGNSLWIDPDFAAEKVDVKVTFRNNPGLFKEFSIYIKKKPDPELKTKEELLKNPGNKHKKAKK